MGLRGMGILNFYSWKLSGEEAFLERFVRPGDFIFFDVGANVGSYTKKVFKHNKKAKAYLFEPNSDIYKELHLSLGGSAEIFQLALGSEEGEADFYDKEVSDGGTHGTLYQSVIEDIHKEKVSTQKVKISTIDNICVEQNITKIDLLKIDVEGHELEVLRGASQTLRAGLVDVIHIEFNEMNVHSRTFLRDFISLLPNHHAYRLLQDGLIPLDRYSPITFELFAYQNIIFTKEKYE